ncbi:uncharacterized protein LOC131251865 [Magnolia sinica]|uniref:uncharacterized protein LOC131251865 n=1 Tax=Magnolia sinica TaxID=86752 RepID=UPI002658679A|nr:uncharacterized protein LOC131251865 [Magnolia sinica]
MESQTTLVTLSIVYAKCSKILRRKLWEDLVTISRNGTGLWVVGGDFNAVAAAEERRGNGSADMDSMANFAEAIQQANLLDTGFTSNNFTWSNNRAVNARVKAAEVDLELSEARLQSSVEESILQESLAIRRKLDNLQLMEEVYWKQKARNSWLEEGDRNTKFFQIVASERSRRAVISSIKDGEGNVITDWNRIKSAAVEFFENLFKEVPLSSAEEFMVGIPSILSAQDNEDLLTPRSMEEVWEAIKEIPKDGAPGPNGFSSAFFTSSWPIVRQDLHKAACAFLEGSSMPRAFSSTLICLIPKNPVASSPKDYRPISLCNVVYKILSKILSTRLGKVLPKIISEEQGAFVKGRSITKNIAMAQEALRNIVRKVRGGNIILKLDLEKANDRVNWNVLKQIMKRFGPTYSHLLFADDTLLFVNGSQHSLRTVNRFLTDYQETTGQCINKEKCRFFCPPAWSAARIKSGERLLGFVRASTEATYLGATLIVGRFGTQQLQCLLGKVSNRISRWNSRHLSEAGRLTLIKSVLGSTPLHIMVAMKIPKWTLIALERKFAQFLWGWTEGNKRLNWIAWKNVAWPIDEGGLGIHRLKDVLLALHLKLAWKLKYSDNQGPWVKLMRASFGADLHEEEGCNAISKRPPF